MMNTKSMVAAIALSLTPIAIMPAYADLPASFGWVPTLASGQTLRDGSQHFTDFRNIERSGKLVSFWTGQVRENSYFFYHFSANCKTHQFVTTEASNGIILVKWPDNGKLSSRPETTSALEYAISAVCEVSGTRQPVIVPYHAKEVYYLENPQ